MTTTELLNSWAEDHKPVPGQPALPPDVRISFEVPTARCGTRQALG